MNNNQSENKEPDFFTPNGFIGYIWEMFKKFYNLGYDEKRRI